MFIHNELCINSYSYVKPRSTYTEMVLTTTRLQSSRGRMEDIFNLDKAIK